ncbi:hypothetical protein EJK15_63945 [Nonomuraea basaltis]|nr:hypothetical protein EJK15_63945 [Nonomuraea basaltis]
MGVGGARAGRGPGGRQPEADPRPVDARACAALSSADPNVWDAHRFARNSRIRLVVAGGSHPRWERNLGTGDDPATSTRMLPSHRTIDLSISRVVVSVTQSPGA